MILAFSKLKVSKYDYLVSEYEYIVYKYLELTQYLPLSLQRTNKKSAASSFTSSTGEVNNLHSL